MHINENASLVNQSLRETSYIPNIWDMLVTYIGHKTSWDSVGGKGSVEKISTNIQNNVVIRQIITW